MERGFFFWELEGDSRVVEEGRVGGFESEDSSRGVS